MKVFAIPKTQINVYSSQFKQNSSVKQNTVTKTNFSGDKFVSKVSFGMASIKALKSQLADLQSRLSKASGKAREDLSKQISELEKTIKKKTRHAEHMIESLYSDVPDTDLSNGT